ncbi:CBF-domain-containing protein [Pleurotus eryngii]|uniref:CBF-domain-containing protein n=1 Tax=Pleurotus eryngii TaxID=5323 RepID=A0A9P6D8R7_PLEER|nr:CBF-domain-containing protein [Pleurotus eryngii]
MARLRKGKDAKSETSKTLQNKTKKPLRHDDQELKSQILALGGNEEDFELVKDTKYSGTGSGNEVTDPTLAGDLRQFVKGLGLKQPVNAKSSLKTAGMPSALDKVSKHKKSPKSLEAPTKKTHSSPEELAISSATGAIKKIEPVKLPSKVSLKAGSRFLVTPTALWYSSIAPLPSSAVPSGSMTPAQLSILTSRAEDLHNKDTITYQTSSSSTSEASFLTKIISSGTLSDRLSALTLLVQSSPLHNAKSLDTLKSMAERGKGKGGREESLKALRCIVDWWVGGGAPDRKLKYFRDQALLNVTDEHLVIWHFEDWLKKYFFSILQILETLCADTLPYVRTQSLNLISTLLRSKPEQEQNLLRLLVNKLGDHEKSISSRASYHLLQLLQTHPSMKSIVIREIAALVFKPAAQTLTNPSAAVPNKHIRFTDEAPKPKSKAPEKKEVGNPHARYYAAITLNQVILAGSDKAVAIQLLEVYFEMFKELLGDGSLAKDDDVPVKSQDEEAEKEVRKDKKGRIFSDDKKRRGKHTKQVQGAAGFMEVEDSQSKMISAILTGINRALPFAKITSEDVGLQKHIDTLFMVTHKSTFNISLQALVLIQQIASSLSTPVDSSSATSSSKLAPSQIYKSIVDRYYRSLYASLHDPRLPHSSKQAMYLNLFFKSVKADHDLERVKGFIRRFVQVLVSGGSGATEFVAGGLYLLGELLSSVPGLRSMVNTPSKTDEVYDPRKRDPQYAQASASPLWELTPLLNHYHPAISLHARQILSSQPITASADLSLNTLSHFLDRFVYKNPKKVKGDNDGVGVQSTNGAKPKGSSVMQPAATTIDGASGVKLRKGEVGDPGGLVNEESFLRRRPQDIPVDQLFFHKYFVRKHEQTKTASRPKDVGDDDAEVDLDASQGSKDSGDRVDAAAEAAPTSEEGTDDEEEAEIWKAMKASMPNVAGDEDEGLDDSDIDGPLDLDSDINDSDSESNVLGGEDSDADDLDLVEDSDADDLIPLDEVPDGLIEYDGSDSGGEDEEGQEDEWGGVSAKKRKRTDDKQSRRKKLKSLPTFASYEDYAKLIEDGPEDDI